MKKHKKYIGLDVHKANSFFVVMDHAGKVLQRAKVVTSESELLRFVRAVTGSKGLAVEETALTQWVYLVLRGEVDQLVVCDPAYNGKRHGPKTDFRDAAELADFLRLNRVNPVFHGADRLMELRVLISGYQDVIQELVRAKNRYKALFGRCALSIEGAHFYNDSSLISELHDDSQRFVAKPLFEQVELLERQRQLYQREFDRNLKRFKEMRLIASIPGLGPIWANQLVGIIVNPFRFANKYKFFSYSCLIRHKWMSDGTLYRNQRARGRVQLKAIFKSAAKSALRGENALRRKYDELRANGASDKPALNAIARHLAATLLAVWKSGKKYNDHYQEVKRGKAYSGRALNLRTC